MEINFKPRAGVTTGSIAKRPATAAALRIHARDMAGAGFYVGLLFSLVFLGAGCAMLWHFVSEMREIPLLVISSVFTLVGGVMTFGFVRVMLDRIRHGSVALHVSEPLPEVGGRLVAWLAVPQAVVAAGRISVEFKCVRSRYVKETSGGKTTIRHVEEPQWTSRTEVPVSGRRADIRFDLPAGLPGSSPEQASVRFISENDPPRHEWVVHVVADIPGVDLDRTYAIPVRGADIAVPATVVASAPKPAPATVLPPGAVPNPPGPASLVMLLLGNLVPLAGVVYWGWSVGDVVLVYWMENLVIGLVNILRLLSSTAPPGDEPAGPAGAFVARLFLAGFFSVHYGMFCFVHGIFIVQFFGAENLREFGFDMPAVVFALLSDRVFAVAILGLAVSHLFSYFHNFLGRGEGRNADPRMIMMRPYGRIIVVHIFILAGGMLSQTFGSGVLVMTLFVVLKVIVDGAFHLRERRVLGGA